MLYLEDYIELIEHLPEEIRENLTHIRELDLAVDTNEHLLEKRIMKFFLDCSKYENEIPVPLKNEYEAIQNIYKSFLDNSDEKISIANHMYEIVEKYLKRLENELFKFKLELEADNKGITEQLEKRSLQLDDHIFHTSPTNSFTRNHYNSSFNYNSLSPQSSQSSYFQQHQHQNQQHIDHQNSQQQHQRDKENRLKRIERRKEAERNATVSSVSNYNSIAVTSVNSNSPVTSNVTKIVSNIPQNSIGYNLGQTGAGTAIAVAASQAIAATQQLQQGRRTASLKASYEAINNSSRELSVAKELQGAAHTALQAIQQDQMSNKRNKKKWIGNLQSLSQQQQQQLSTSAPTSILGRSSPNISIQSSQSQILSVSNSNSQSADIYVDNVVTETTNCDVSLDNKWLSDPNEPRYCVCNQVSYGDMVACDDSGCPFEWFHYACVGVTAPPKGKWYCPQCSSSRKKSRKN